MIVVDTSVWIDYFRGQAETVSRLNELLDDESVLLAAPVWIELLSGASSRDLPVLRQTLSAIPRAIPNRTIWKTLEAWVSISAQKGKRFGLGDLIIAAICSETDSTLWSHDKDFVAMSRLKFVKLM